MTPTGRRALRAARPMSGPAGRRSRHVAVAAAAVLVCLTAAAVAVSAGRHGDQGAMVSPSLEPAAGAGSSVSGPGTSADAPGPSDGVGLPTPSAGGAPTPSGTVGGAGSTAPTRPPSTAGAPGTGPTVAERMTGSGPLPVVSWPIGPSTAPHGSAPLVIPVEPVGSDIPGGRKSLASVNAEVDDAQAAGAVGIRVVVDMKWMCSTATCDFAPVAPLVTRAGALGLKVFFHVNSTPDWLDPRGRWYGPTGEIGRRWAGLFAQLTNRFGTSVAGYEVWNEPNIDEFWAQGSNPSEYADLLRSVWTAVKPSQPNVRLIGGVLSNNDLGWMHQLDVALKAIGGTTANRYYYDVLGVHPYAGGADVGYDPSLSPGSKVVTLPRGQKDMTFRGVVRLREQVARDEGLARTVVIGEFGYSTKAGDWYHVPEPRRGTYLGSALDIAGTWPWLEAFTVYSYSGLASDGFSVIGTPSQRILRLTS